MRAGPAYEAIRDAVERTGLRVRGGFHPGSEDAVPALRTGANAGTVFLLGNVGSSAWGPFVESGYLGRAADPLDDWSRAVISGLAERLGADPLFPFGGPPYLPFIRWALRADTVWPSVMGPLIHPRYGLWHAYRGALSFPERLYLPPRPDADTGSPCEGCRERPCLVPCPVGAVREGAFDGTRCAGWLTTRPESDCREGGCLARRACPVGSEHAYVPVHAAFHMAAFARANAAAAASGGSGGDPSAGAASPAVGPDRERSSPGRD